MIYRDESTVWHSRGERQEPWAASTEQIRARFTRARAAGRPQWLWPEIAVADWREALQQIERATRALLLDRPPPTLLARTASGVPAFCLAAYTSGLGPWLGGQIEAGRLAADDALAGVCAAHLDHNRRRWPRVERALEQAAAALAARNVDATVIKGAVTARRCFAEPALRPMADIDVVVDAAEFDAAGRALGAVGFMELPAGRRVRPRRSEWRPPDSSTGLRSLMLVHAEDPIAVDLHGSLEIDFFGVQTVAFGAGSSWSPEAMESFGPGLRAPGPVLLTAHQAVHASHGLHGLTLLRLLELVLLLRDLGPAGIPALSEMLRELRAERFAFPALALAERLAPGTVAGALLQRCAAAAPVRLRQVVARLSPATAQRLDRLALEERFMWGTGPVDHLRRLRTMLLPTGGGAPLRRLAGIYTDRAFRLMRLRVGWRSNRDRG